MQILDKVNNIEKTQSKCDKKHLQKLNKQNSVKNITKHLYKQVSPHPPPHPPPPAILEKRVNRVNNIKNKKNDARSKLMNSIKQGSELKK